MDKGGTLHENNIEHKIVLRNCTMFPVYHSH